MYGLINKGLQEMVVKNYGEDAWKSLCMRAGVGFEEFITMKQYSDEVTFKLIGLLSEDADVAIDELLVNFGLFWIDYAYSDETYGELMRASGDTFVDFLKNLDLMHEQISLSFSNLKQPSFHIEEDPDCLLVEYVSSRRGLASFVKGLLLGLADYFKVRVDVSQVAIKDEEGGNDVFRVSFVK